MRDDAHDREREDEAGRALEFEPELEEEPRRRDHEADDPSIAGDALPGDGLVPLPPDDPDVPRED